MVLYFLLTVAFGFIGGYIFCGILVSDVRADELFYEGIVMDLHKQLDEADEAIGELSDVIFVLSNEKANLLDKISLLEEELNKREAI